MFFCVEYQATDGQDKGQDPVPLGAYAGNEIIHARYRDTTTGKLHVRRQQADTNFGTFFCLTSDGVIHHKVL